MPATEIWLRSNRRALAVGLVPPLMIAVVGAGLIFGERALLASWVGWLGAAMSLVGVGVVGLLAWQMRVPRIAYRGGKVLFQLQHGPALAVPVDVVEAFFIGQQPQELPGHDPGNHAAMNLVARLSQRATEWRQRDVKPALGSWSDGYVIVHGLWCEPITGDLVRRLNHRLREVHDERRTMPGS